MRRETLDEGREEGGLEYAWQLIAARSGPRCLGGTTAIQPNRPLRLKSSLDAQHIAVLAASTGAKLGDNQVPATQAGYQQMLGFLASFGSVRHCPASVSDELRGFGVEVDNHWRVRLAGGEAQHETTVRIPHGNWFKAGLGQDRF